MNSKLIYGIFFLCLPLFGKADLLHHYIFEASDPYADLQGGSDLTPFGTVGTITASPEGFISFSGTDTQSDTVYLGGDALNNVFDPFVLNLWFRVPTTTGQSIFSSLFSSNEGTDAGFQIHFLDGFFGVNMNGIHLEVLPLDQLTVNEWHLVTVMQDPNASEQGQIWLDGTAYDSNAGSFGELNSFRLGVNRAGRQGIEGDIAEVKIYNGEVWDSTKQAELYAMGPVIPEPAVCSLILFSGITVLGIKRIFLK